MGAPFIPPPHPIPSPGSPIPRNLSSRHSTGGHGPAVHDVLWCTPLSSGSTNQQLYRRESVCSICRERAGRYADNAVLFIIFFLISSPQTLPVDLIRSEMLHTLEIARDLLRIRSVFLEPGEDQFARS